MAKKGKKIEESLPSYLARLTQAPLLTAEEEKALTRAAKDGSEEARDRLVESNIRLVINIAKSYQSWSIPLEDLIQEGVIGLMTAIERFDPEKGFRFSTYATHWIRQSVGRAIDGKAKTIRLPAHISQTLRKIEKAKKEILADTGKDATPEQIAQMLGISLKKLKSLMQASQELVSLDIRVGDDDSTTLGAMIQDERAGDPSAIVINGEILEELQDVINELSDRERRIMNHRLKHDDGTPAFRDDLSEEMQISRERIRQIEIQAIKKLRQIAQRRRLREYLS